MNVENRVHPSESQMQGFFESAHDKPIYMLNLLKFKDKAEYPDGPERARQCQPAGARAGCRGAR